MTPIAERLACIAASLPAVQSHIAAELSEMSVQVARLERAQRLPADALTCLCSGPAIRPRGDGPKWAA